MHYIELLPIKDINKLNYYVNQNLSRNELRKNKNKNVVVELKVNKLKKQDIWRIMIYMNYVNENIRRIGQDKTIGIIVCRENNRYLIKYSSNKRIYATTYKIV